MEEKPPVQNSALLSSWKEIAAYLGVSVRTAQKWEAERGLPVQRIPGGRGRVLISVEALAAWMQTPGIPPVQPDGPELVEPRRLRLRWIAAAAVFLVVFAAGGAAWVAWHMQPASWRVDGDFLVVSDDHGREIWRNSFGFPLRDYKAFTEYGLNAGWIGDLDGDGSSEVVFVVGPKEDGTPMVVCFSHTGARRWQFVPGANAKGFPSGNRPPFHPVNLVLFRSGGVWKIVVASLHHTNSPASISLLSATGELEREYWHSGFIQFLTVADFAGTGKPLIYAAGIANGYNRAVLVVLDPENFGGTSREENPEYQLPGPPACEVSRVLFPRSCINLRRQTYNGVISLHARPDGLEVGVAEEVNTSYLVIHHFDPDGTYQGATLSSQFQARHNELEHTRFLDHPLNRKRESAELSHLTWLTGKSIIRPNQ